MNTPTIEAKRSAVRAKHPTAQWHEAEDDDRAALWVEDGVMYGKPTLRAIDPFHGYSKTEYNEEEAWAYVFSSLTPEDKALAVVCPKCKPIANWLNGQIGFKCWEGKICPERIQRVLEMEAGEGCKHSPYLTRRRRQRIRAQEEGGRGMNWDILGLSFILVIILLLPFTLAYWLAYWMSDGFTVFSLQDAIDKGIEEGIRKGLQGAGWVSKEQP